MSLTFIHSRLANTVILYFLLLMLWSFWRYFHKQGLDSNFRGALVISDEPGLGIELDRAMLAKLHERYKACGLQRRDDEIEMQKVQPGWKFQSVRW